MDSVSFEKNSALPLRYACEKRGDGKGCIVAVQFDDLDHQGLKPENSLLYLYPASGLQPVIIGYCVVPPKTEYVYR